MEDCLLGIEFVLHMCGKTGMAERGQWDGKRVVAAKKDEKIQPRRRSL